MLSTHRNWPECVAGVPGQLGGGKEREIVRRLVGRDDRREVLLGTVHCRNGTLAVVALRVRAGLDRGQKGTRQGVSRSERIWDCWDAVRHIAVAAVGKDVRQVRVGVGAQVPVIGLLRAAQGDLDITLGRAVGADVMAGPTTLSGKPAHSRVQIIGDSRIDMGVQQAHGPAHLGTQYLSDLATAPLMVELISL
ncbi:MAG: hypothetical protein ACRDTH_18325, partial [Pseudonocardiaceae bacterium]